MFVHNIFAIECSNTIIVWSARVLCACECACAFDAEETSTLMTDSSTHLNINVTGIKLEFSFEAKCVLLYDYCSDLYRLVWFCVWNVTPLNLLRTFQGKKI